MRSGIKKLSIVTAVAMTGSLSVWAAAPGQATEARPGETSASAKSFRYLEFDKNPKSPTNSRLRLIRYDSSASPKRKVLRSYRAGSGTTTNPCSIGKGWLPNGNYKIEFHQKNFDGIINGNVIKISNKKCGSVTRTELFIHSEMTPSRGQGSIESERWDGPSDYLSNGCVKLTPAAIKSLFRIADSGGWPTKLKVK
jgi:lipoprotein-anchoring transpeptidase ErfK/SrfK